jgi:NitT/TauT family transport system substrate-binding protein
VKWRLDKGGIMLKLYKLLAGVIAVCAVGAAQAQAPVKVKVAEVVRSQLFAHLYLAINQGFVKAEGLEVELVTAGGGDKVGALILSKQAEVGLAGPEVPIYIYNGDSPDKPLMFASLNGTDGFFLVSRRKIDNFQWSMLNGQKIMGWRPGSTPELFLESVMKHNGVDAKTIKEISTNIAPPAREGAWLAGGPDFAIFNEPATTKLEKAGQVHVLKSIGREAGRVENTVLFANKSWISANRATAQKLTNALAKAQQWMAKASPEEVAKAMASYFPGVPLEDSANVIRRYRATGAPVYSESTVIPRDGLAKLQEVMVEGGILPAGKMVAYDSIVITDIAKEAQRRAGSH